MLTLYHKITQFIAKTSVNGTFLAQVGHFSVSFILVEHLPGRHLWWALAMLGWATVKEWWFDSRFEGASFWNNLLDYTFYNLGIWAAYLLVR